MLYSTDRILTTHAGALPRPPDLGEMVTARANGSPYDPAEFDARLKSAVADVVRRQAECGIDCVNDGELSKTNFTDYVRGRIAGYEARPSSGIRRLSITARDERNFAGYFLAYPRNRPAGRPRMPVCVGDVRYVVHEFDGFLESVELQRAGDALAVQIPFRDFLEQPGDVF